jgi:hypothetical protein
VRRVAQAVCPAGPPEKHTGYDSFGLSPHWWGCVVLMSAEERSIRHAPGPCSIEITRSPSRKSPAYLVRLHCVLARTWNDARSSRPTRRASELANSESLQLAKNRAY